MTGDTDRRDFQSAEDEGPVISRRRADLASFDHAYAVALQVRRHTGRCQFILRTGNVLQPVRTSSLPPRLPEILLAIIA
jgi:hypothetical protein